MDREFRPSDNERIFILHGTLLGRIEYPLEDPGTAQPGEAIFWFGEKQPNGAGWAYVGPADVEPLEAR